MNVYYRDLEIYSARQPKGVRAPADCTLWSLVLLEEARIVAGQRVQKQVLYFSSFSMGSYGWKNRFQAAKPGQTERS